MFHDALNTLNCERIEAFVYANVLRILESRYSRLDLEKRGQHAITIIERWCESEKLSVSQGKSEMILLRGHLDVNRLPTIIFQAKEIRIVKIVRYPGVYFGEGLRIRTHVRKIRSKCVEKFNFLAAIARRNWELKSIKVL